MSLAGTRFQNDYAHNVVYQHIYLNDRYETWLSLDGPQKGQADTEEYLAFKVADGVYCTFWNEKVLTTQMTFLFNFVKGECVCEVFGTTDGERVYNTIGATTRVIHSEIDELDVPRLSGLSALTSDRGSRSRSRSVPSTCCTCALCTRAQLQTVDEFALLTNEVGLPTVRESCCPHGDNRVRQADSRVSRSCDGSRGRRMHQALATKGS